jgi:hypothetical protein
VIDKRFRQWSFAETLVGTPLKDSNKIQSPSGCFLFTRKPGSIAKKCKSKQIPI